MAVPKSHYLSQTIKEEDSQDDIKVEKIEIKEEAGGEGVSGNERPMLFDYSDVKVKQEKLSDDEGSDSGLEEEGSDDDSVERNNEEKSDSDDDDDDDDEDDDSESDEEEEDEKPKKKPGRKPESTAEPSKDVAEERTLFIKNLSFDATEEDISGVLSRFGDLKYVLLCMDPLTEHPRGTAFAQFKVSI